jgi:hypothetical protein
MKVQVILMGGSHTGSLFTLTTSSEVPSEIRIGDLADKGSGKVWGDLYRLKSWDSQDGHVFAGYDYLNEIETASGLIDHWEG